jgi:hypothetical protein
MNEFLVATKQALNLHGKPAVYTRVSAGVYDIETGGQTNTSTDHTIVMYKKHIRANQYNYPNLVGKDAAMFYIAADALAFLPNFKDTITFDSIKYEVQSYNEHAAKGQVVLIKILAVKG